MRTQDRQKDKIQKNRKELKKQALRKIESLPPTKLEKENFFIKINVINNVSSYQLV